MKVKKAWLVPIIGPMKRLTELEGKELALSDLYPLIGNGCHTAERVALKKGVDMWVDEEGLLKTNQVNGIGTFLYQHQFAIGHGINPRVLGELGVVGTAILIDNTKAGDFITE